jgi:hypothetical protein
VRPPAGNAVQDAQGAYLDAMEIHWQCVRGEITHAGYWQISEGPLQEECRRKIDEAVAAAEAGEQPRPMTRRARRHQRNCQRLYARSQARREAAGISEPTAADIMMRIAGS